MKSSHAWLSYTTITIVSWGVWGALIEVPQKSGFPSSLGYIVWAFTMIPFALVVMYQVNWRIETDKRSILLGSAIGLLGAGGQLLLFEALREGHAYIVFPFIALYPILTIILSVIFLKEKTSVLKWIGIVFALAAIFLLSHQEQGSSDKKGYLWLALSLMVFVAWGFQAYLMKFSNETMKAASIFFYIAVTALILCPFAWFMTDFSQKINWGFKGPYLAALVHLMNSAGALMLIYALRYGKAIIVMPLIGLAPVITIVLSLFLYSVIPGPMHIIGLVFAMLAILTLWFR